MRVSALIVMPAGKELRSGAAAGLENAMSRLSMSAPPQIGGFELDKGFAPIALGGSSLANLSLESATPAAAPSFVVRGTVDLDKFNETEAAKAGASVFSDPEIGLMPSVITCGGSPPVGNAALVAKKLQVSRLHSRKLDGNRVALAIVDTGINLAHLKTKGLKPRLDKTITLPPPGVPQTPGGYPVDHGTMCAYDALIEAPAATLLDFPLLRSTTPGGSVMAGFLSDALRVYAFLINQLRSPGWKYRALVVNNSWGMFHPSWDFPVGHPGRYADNPNHPFNIIVGTLARAGADIIFAAGNCGANCPDGRCQGVVTNAITGANAHPDVLTLAGCDTNDARVGYSSQGPAIPGMHKQKPDVTTYTHFLGSEAFGAGAPDSGTSTSCPVAAGCVAAIRTKLGPSTASPAQVFQAIRATAMRPSGAGWNRDLGFGLFNPDKAASSLGV
jgi:Subtilase family